MTTPEKGEGLIATWLPGIVAYVALLIISEVFGFPVAAWIASVLLAFCIGVFWGAGDQIRKHKAANHLNQGKD